MSEQAEITFMQTRLIRLASEEWHMSVERVVEFRAGKFIYDNNNNFTSINLVILSNYVINNLKLKKIKIASGQTH